MILYCFAKKLTWKTFPALITFTGKYIHSFTPFMKNLTHSIVIVMYRVAFRCKEIHCIQAQNTNTELKESSSCWQKWFFHIWNWIVLFFRLLVTKTNPQPEEVSAACGWCGVNWCPGAERVPSDTGTGTKGTLQRSSLAVLGGSALCHHSQPHLYNAGLYWVTSACLQIIFPMFFLLILPAAFYPKTQPFAKL